MTSLELYYKVCEETSQRITKRYSSSFSRSVKLLQPEIRTHIYNVYGFVRLADEIVDTFHAFNKEKILNQFIKEYRDALIEGISINPVINAFCITQKKYDIPQHLVDAFLNSMQMDLGNMLHLNRSEYETYIYGSAEVVGLICLLIFVKGDKLQYQTLKPSAQSLGAALQKVNFLRDIDADYHKLNRSYFPNVDFTCFSELDKKNIEEEIKKDFEIAIQGIQKLPLSSRFAVYLAYRYYHGLFKKIEKTQPSAILKKRIRLNNLEKLSLFLKILIYKNFNLNPSIS